MSSSAATPVTRRVVVAGATLLVVALVLGAPCNGRSPGDPVAGEEIRPRSSAPDTVTRAPSPAHGRQTSATAWRSAVASDLGSRSWRPSLLLTELIDPECRLGPRALCDAIATDAQRCTDGDASACVDAASYLEARPPRAVTLILFYRKACVLGHEAACVRASGLASAETGATVPQCAADPLACALGAAHRRDPVLLDQACKLGVSHACVRAVGLVDPAQAREFQQRACDFGDPDACFVLADRLSSTCDPSERTDCYPADEEAERVALLRACSSGIPEACERV